MVDRRDCGRQLQRLPVRSNGRSYKMLVMFFYVAAKATYIRLLHGKMASFCFGGGGFGPSSVKWGRTQIVLG